MFPLTQRFARLLFLPIFLCGVARAQLTPDWITRLPLGSSLSAGVLGMTVDAAGITYVTGITGSSSNSDVLVAAIGTNGSVLWSHDWNGPANWHDQGRAVALGPGGVLYVTGNTPDAMSYANVLLLKYDAASGNLLSTIQYSSAPGTSEHGGSVAVDAQGNVYVGGGTVGDGSDGLILKFDAAGVLQWTRTWDGPAASPYSGDDVLQVRIAPNGHPIALVHGEMASLHPDYVVLDLDPTSGNSVWEAVWGVSGGDFARDMEIDAAGDVYVTGTGIDFVNKFSTIKLRGTDGQLLWQVYDTAGASNSASALALDGQGGVYVTGSTDPDGDHSNFNDNVFTVKHDASTGALVWTFLYGLNCVGCYDVSGDVVVDAAGHVFVGGATSSAPYSADAITFVLDASTGVEMQRGVVAEPSPFTISSGPLRFDAAFDLFNGAHSSNSNTGAVEFALIKYPSLSGSAGSAFCAGDGSGAQCPCGNSSPPGSIAGCTSSLGVGARLLGAGVASLAADTLVLQGAQMPNSFALYFQGTTQTAAGAGSVFGDGLRCASGSVSRLGAKQNAQGASQYPLPGDAHVSVAGVVTAPGTRTYQVWYRNAASFCTPSTFNLSNGWEVVWGA